MLSESINYIEKFLNSGIEFRRYSVEVAKKLGHVAYAIVLADMLDQYIFFFKCKTLKSHIRHGDGLMFYTVQHAYERTAVKRRQFQTAIQKFMDLGLLSTVSKIDFEGKTYYKFDLEAVASHLQTMISEAMYKCTLPNVQNATSQSTNVQPMKTIKNPIQESRYVDGASAPSFEKGRNIDSFDPATFLLADGSHLSFRTQKQLAKTMQNPAGLAKILRSINYYQEQIGRNVKPKKSHEIMLQWIINKDFGLKADYADQNELYAKFLVAENKLSNIEILKSVIVFKMGRHSESLSKDMQPENFASTFNHLLNKFKENEKNY